MATRFMPIYPETFTIWPDEATATVGATGHNFWGNIAQQAHDFAIYQTTSENGDTWEVPFLCAAKTYGVIIQYIKYITCGIVDFYIDDVAVVTGVDMYGASFGYNQRATFNVTLSAGRHVLKWVVNGKNAASSDYNFTITKITGK